jgi:hypothetical protein
MRYQVCMYPHTDGVEPDHGQGMMQRKLNGNSQLELCASAIKVSHSRSAQGSVVLLLLGASHILCSSSIFVSSSIQGCDSASENLWSSTLWHMLCLGISHFKILISTRLNVLNLRNLRFRTLIYSADHYGMYKERIGS